MSDATETTAYAPVALDRAQPLALRSILLRGAQLLVLAAVVIFVARALRAEMASVPWSQIHLRPLLLLPALALGAVASILNAISYWRLIGGFAPAPPLPVVCAITWLPILGKYVPGKFASVAGGIWLLRRHQVPAAVGASVVLLQAGLAVLTGLMIAAPLCLWQPVYLQFPFAWAGSLVVLAGGVGLLHPRILSAVTARPLRWLRQEPLSALPPLSHYLVPMLLLIVSWGVTGVATWLTARALIDVPLSLLPFFAGAEALAMSLGTLALIPGGLGVREGVLLIVLTPLIGPVAAVVALVLRVCQTLTEVVMAAVGMAILYRGRTRCDGGRTERKRREHRQAEILLFVQDDNPLHLSADGHEPRP